MTTQHHITEDAKGLKTFSSAVPFQFEKGGNIAPWQLVFETYGELTPAKDNVVLIHHALSTNSHIASHAKNPTPGWWEEFVGPGKAVDTAKFFVICINNLGSCFGSAGPAAINPLTSKPYRRDFPFTTINDMVYSQQLLLESLGIEKLYAVIGNSMGAMISLAWAILYPEKVERLVSVSSCYKAYPMSVATHEVQREIIELDPHWQGGYYTTPPLHGFNTARKFGLLIYRNPGELNTRFDKDNSLLDYLTYNAEKFTAQFDVNSYLYIYAAMDDFDVTRGYANELEPFRKIKAKCLVISVTTDLLFPPQQQKDLYEKLAAAGANVNFVAHDSNYGHDAFYADKTINLHVKKFLE